MIIAFFGQMATAKDTAADYLYTKLSEKDSGQSWQRTAFANAVKDTFCRSFGVTREFIEEWKRSTECAPGMKLPLRKALQFIGDGFRQIRDEIWIEIALNDAENKILSDGRYRNESKAVKDRDGITVLLYRPGFVNDDPNPSEAEMRPIANYCHKHFSDGPLPMIDDPDAPDGLEHIDYFIRNEGSLEDFYQKIDTQLIPFIEKRLYSYC